MSSTAIVVDHLRGGLRCGEPQRSGPLTLVPLFHSGAAASYRLFAEALAAGRVTVEEVGAGSVPELALVNRGGEAVLVIEGEVLSGLRQTRIVNASVLVPPRTRLNLPVSCVEAGRWGAAQPAVRGEIHASPRLREAKNQGVRREARAGGGYRSDQGAVWREVEDRLAAHRVASPTASYADLTDRLAARVGDLAGRLRPQPGQQGVLALAAGRAVAADVFDRAETLAGVWPGLVASYAADALVADCPTGNQEPEAAALLAGVAAGEASSHPGVGLGEVVFLTSGDCVASALVAGDTVVHLAALWARGEVPAPGEQAAGTGRRSWFGEPR